MHKNSKSADIISNDKVKLIERNLSKNELSEKPYL